MITELAKGKTIEQALKITRKDVADELDGLPPIKMHCSNLAADALKDAVKNYREKQKPELQPAETKDKQGKIIGEKEFLNRGVYHQADDILQFKDKRVIVVDKGDKSIETAIELTKQTPRVVYVTAAKEISTNPDLNTKLKQSNVKVLYESEIVEVRGMNTVEKVLIHDLNEDEEYELFIDSLIILQ
jgi:nitrogen fixation NifU-like protein